MHLKEMSPHLMSGSFQCGQYQCQVLLRHWFEWNLNRIWFLSMQEVHRRIRGLLSDCGTGTTVRLYWGWDVTSHVTTVISLTTTIIIFSRPEHGRQQQNIECLVKSIWLRSMALGVGGQTWQGGVSRSPGSVSRDKRAALPLSGEKVSWGSSC